MTARSATIHVMAQAAQKAAKSLIRDFGEVEHLQVSRKGPADFVTVADQKAEQILKQELARARPGFGFLMEESGATPGKADSDCRWIVDPLDGTTNFLHGIPHFAISIGLEKAGELVAGVIYDPIKDEIFYAEKGAGAFVNNRRLRVSARTNLTESLLATGIPFAGKKGHKRQLKAMEAVTDRIAGIRRFGAASLDLAYVAAGRYEAFWEWNLQPWDVAAGIVLVREAGGSVSDIDTDANPLNSGNILAANQAVYQPLRDVLKAIKD